jgi:hypothetical protein
VFTSLCSHSELSLSTYSRPSLRFPPQSLFRICHCGSSDPGHLDGRYGIIILWTKSRPQIKRRIRSPINEAESERVATGLLSGYQTENRIRHEMENHGHNSTSRLGSRSQLTMEYIVCESRRSKNYDSRPDDVPVKIHTVLCTNYQERELNIWSMKWSLVFNKIKDAEKYAEQTERQWDYCKVCLRKQRVQSPAVA